MVKPTNLAGSLRAKCLVAKHSMPSDALCFFFALCVGRRSCGGTADDALSSPPPTPSGGSSAASSVVVLPVTTTSTVVSGSGPLPTVAVPSATPPVLGLPTSGVLGAHTSGLPTFRWPAARPAALPPVTLSSAPTPTIGPGVVQMIDPAEVEVDMPDKVRLKILNLEYVEKSDLLPENWHCEEVASSCCHTQTHAQPSRKGSITLQYTI